MSTKVAVPFLVAMMLLTGVCNTLLTKYQDLQCVRNCHSSDPKKQQHFEQPVIQTAQMFIGEMGCWLVVGGFTIYKRYFAKAAPMLHGGYQPVNGSSGNGALDSDEDGGLLDHTPSAQEAASPAAKPLVPNADGRRPLVGWRVILLALPACCDIAGTTLMNVGLLFVAASIYQMTRGALVLFVALFSVLFLRRKLYLYQWSSLFIVVLGVGIVGLAGAIAPNPQAKPEPKSVVETGLLLLRATGEHVKTTVQTPEAVQTIIGVLLIAGAQIFTATQFVLEEYILEQYALEPLKVVGWEGVFGLTVTLLGMLILHFAVGRTEKGRYGYFDAREGWREITHYRAIAISSILIMFSIGGFNFFGLSVTRTVSATARSTIDTCRTLFIWIVSLGLGWETFKWLQILGFALLVYGTFLFNDIVRPPLKACVVRRRKREELLPEEPIEHV
ncbi:MAG: hypothetical protein M1830_007806 [Pleopsidium flavum]|nr:MAG: hypothetical protein M1830_007806 [Pleopsidium flavum]